MKQKNKSLALIALVLVVAALGAALVFLNGLEEEEDPGLPLFGLDAADITGISYQKADDAIDVTLLKQDGAWTLTSDPALPLDQGLCRHGRGEHRGADRRARTGPRRTQRRGPRL